MGSQDSNSDSLGLAVDHEGNCLEDYMDVISSTLFAISSSVFQELSMGLGAENRSSHLEPNPLDRVDPSASGGIPVVGGQLDGPFSSEDDDELIKDNGRTSSIFKSMLWINKNDRDELFTARSRINDLHNFRLKQGFKLDDVDKSYVKDGFKKPPLVRDEYGLPIIPKAGGLGIQINSIKNGVKDATEVPATVGLKSILKPVTGANLRFELGSTSGTKDSDGKDKDVIKSGDGFPNDLGNKVPWSSVAIPHL